MINLDKHIEILLLSNDCVIVPGFGGFMAHHIDARKDDSDGSFLPPIRSIGFNPKLTLNDSLLTQSYVEAYDISYPDAVMRIEDEVRELKQRIATDGKYEFTDIGTISINSDGNYEFSPCEAGIVSPELYGLGNFKMKTLAELKSAMQIVLNEPSESQDSKKTEKKQENTNGIDKHSAKIIALWRNVAVACIAIIIFLLIPSPLVNDTQMAGNHIDTELLDRVLPKDITTGKDKVSESVKNTNVKALASIKANDAESSKTITEKAKEKGFSTTKPIKEGFAIVLASRVTLKNANEYVSKLHRRGYNEAYIQSNGHVKVLFGQYKNREEASKALNSLNDKEEFAGAWITNVQFK